jgi:hypothetical protein
MSIPPSSRPAPPMDILDILGALSILRHRERRENRRHERQLAAIAEQRVAIRQQCPHVWDDRPLKLKVCLICGATYDH